MLQPIAVHSFVIDDQDARLTSTGPVSEVAQTVEEVLGVDGLDEVIERDQSSAEVGIVDDTHDDDRNMARSLVALEARKDLPAIDVRQQDVQGDGGRLALFRHAQRLGTAASDFRAKTGAPDLPREQLGRSMVILNDDDQRTGVLAAHILYAPVRPSVNGNGAA